MNSSSWSENAFLRPNNIDDITWNKILINFLGEVGDPVISLPSALDNDQTILQNFGNTQANNFTALQFTNHRHLETR